MVEYVVKRDGRKESFDIHRIENAVLKAFKAASEGERSDAEEIAMKVASRLSGEAHVEEIQDLVEEGIMRSGFLRAAKAYIIYREQHRLLRETRDLVSDAASIESYLGGEDWMVKENSNMTYSLQGLNFYLSSKSVAHYWLNRIYQKDVREAHISGDIHIHDLGILGPYCVGWDLKDLLVSGFKGVPGKIQSKPARHLRSAFGQVVNFFYTLQGEAAGAQSFSSLDTYLAPFIRHDSLGYEEVRQAMQEFIFNLNVPTRVGFQAPFVNVTLDLQAPKFMEKERVIWGGVEQQDSYGGFQEEMDLFNRAFADVMLEGDARGRPFTFPIPTLNITKDFDWDNPAYERIWEMTAKYGIPYFSNFINSDMDPGDVKSMCCRLRLDLSELRRRGGGLFGANPLTGSIGVVTLNLPRIGFLAGDEGEYLERVDFLMDLARDSLEVKRLAVEGFTEKGLYPYSRFYLRSVKESFGGYWKNHFSTIGLLGMNESLVNLMGEDVGSAPGRKFAVKVLKHMRNRLSGFQEETGCMYNLEATPAEGASYRLARIDRMRYPEIHAASDASPVPYYTNSSQLPVTYTDDLFGALELQDELQTLYTGGTVFHGFVGERIRSHEAVKLLVRRIFENFRLPYLTLTPTFSVCPEHGYLSGEHDLCPVCGSESEVYSRSVGYLRPISQWNAGKLAEFRDRRNFKL